MHWVSCLKRIIPSTHDKNNPKGVWVSVGAVQQGHYILLHQLILHPGVHIVDTSPNIIPQELNLIAKLWIIFIFTSWKQYKCHLKHDCFLPGFSQVFRQCLSKKILVFVVAPN